MGASKFRTEALKTEDQLQAKAIDDLEKDQRIDADLTVQYCRKAVRTAETDVLSNERGFVTGNASAAAVLFAREKLAKAVKAYDQAEAFVKEFFGE